MIDKVSLELKRSFEDKSLFFFIIGLIPVFFVAFALWYDFFLPFSYYFGIFLIGLTAVFSTFKCKSRILLAIQLAAVFFLIRSVYNLSMDFSLIPFGDGNWDYAVVKTFMARNEIFVIQQPSLLRLYSGWPLLHIIAMFGSLISGIDPYVVAIIIPYVFDVVLFVIVFLIFEELRDWLGLTRIFLPIALILYSVSPESIFWQMQFVRQNLGVLLFAFMIYCWIKLIKNWGNIRYHILLVVIVITLVVSHHFSSFIAVSFSVLFIFISTLFTLFFREKNAFPRTFIKGIFFVTFLMIVVLLFWWSQFATMVWPYFVDSIEHFEALFSGMNLVLTPKAGLFPQELTPWWAISLLRIRDFLVYIPAVLSFFLLVFKKQYIENSKLRLFLIYSGLSFASLLFLDFLIFRLGTTRILSIGLPLLVFLSGFFYYSILKNFSFSSKIVRVVAVSGILVLLLFSSFIGLWGHNFAPIHLYDPMVDPIDVGERNPEFSKVLAFTQNLSFGDFDVIWADDRSPMLYLLEPEYFDKIRWIPVENIDSLGTYGKEIVFGLKDLNMYFYHAGYFSPVRDPSEADSVREAILNRLNQSFENVYDDGVNTIWVSIS